MASGIIAAVATLLGLAFWLIKRYAAREDDPLHQHKEAYDQIDEDISKGDSVSATIHASDQLDALERLRSRQGHSK